MGLLPPSITFKLDRVVEALGADQNPAASADTLEKIRSRYGSSPDLEIAEAYLALRMNDLKRAEQIATRVCEQLKNLSSVNMVNTLAHVLQKTGSYRHLLAVYGRCIEMSGGPTVPASTAAQCALFNAQILAGEYSAAQQTATQLHRITKDPSHHLRVVFANLRAYQEGGNFVLLQIAERYLRMLIDKESLTPSIRQQVVEMYVDTLNVESRSAEAVKFLLTSTSTFGLDSWRFGLLLRVADKLTVEMPHKSAVTPSVAHRKIKNALAKQAWLHEPDNWDFATAYLGSLCDTSEIVPFGEITSGCLPHPNWAPGGATPGKHSRADLTAKTFAWSADNFDAAERLCHTLQDSRTRGPYLAELELRIRRHSARDAEELPRVIQQFCTLFAGKGVCFLDLATFAASLNETGELWEGTPRPTLNSLFENFDSVLTAEQRSHAGTVHTWRMLRMKIDFLINGVTSVNPETCISECTKTYADNNSTLSAGRGWSEEGALDHYLLIAANKALVAQHAAVNEEEKKRWALVIVSALHCMERRMNNPAVLAFRILACQRLDIADTESIEKLALRDVQHSTLSHIGFWPLLRGGCFHAATQYLANAFKYFYNVKRDAAMLRDSALKNLAFTRLEEIDRFEDRLQNSLAWQEAILMHTAVSLRECQTLHDVAQHLAHSIDLVLDARERVPRAQSIDDDEFIILALFQAPRGAALRALQKELFFKPELEWRKARLLALADALILLYDVVVVASKETLATKEKSMGSGKRAKLARAALQEQGMAQRELLCPKLGITHKNFAICPAFLSFCAAEEGDSVEIRQDAPLFTTRTDFFIFGSVLIAMLSSASKTKYSVKELATRILADAEALLEQDLPHLKKEYYEYAARIVGEKGAEEIRQFIVGKEKQRKDEACSFQKYVRSELQAMMRLR